MNTNQDGHTQTPNIRIQFEAQSLTSITNCNEDIVSQRELQRIGLDKARFSSLQCYSSLERRRIKRNRRKFESTEEEEEEKRVRKMGEGR